MAIKLNSGTALLIFVVIAVLIFILARANKIRPWSAVVLGLLLAQIVVGLFYPIGKDPVMTVLSLVVSLIVLFYVFSKALTDREGNGSLKLNL